MFRLTQRKTLWSLVALVAAVLATEAGAQEPVALPFDGSLSIYVAHIGTWTNYETGQDEVAEIEDPLAAFRPGERVSDVPSLWGAHQINRPEAPEGWQFFSPVCTEPMRLDVLVRDTRRRLRDVLVRNYDSGALLGTIRARPARSTVSGSVVVPPSTEAFRLVVRARDGSVLSRLVVMNPRIDEALAFTHEYAWELTPAGKADDSVCPVSRGPAYADLSKPGVKVTVTSPRAFRACNGPRVFENDRPYALPLGCRYRLCKDNLLTDPNFTTDLPLPVRRAVGGKVYAVWRSLQVHGPPVPFKHLDAPPFSKGAAHWPMTCEGRCTAIVYFPYRGRAKYSDTEREHLSAFVGAFWDDGLGTGTPGRQVALRLNGALTADQRRELQCGNAVAAQTLWCLSVLGAEASTLRPLDGITAPVTFELRIGQPAPSPGTWGPAGGMGSVKVASAWTSPAPPTPEISTAQLTFPSKDGEKGVCRVELAKGWRWSSLARAVAYPQAGPGIEAFQTPRAGAVRFHMDGFAPPQ